MITNVYSGNIASIENGIQKKHMKLKKLELIQLV